MKCRITGEEFERTAQEAAAYARFGLPLPDTHPKIRLLEKLAYGNTWNLYQVREARTGKEILSNYNPTEHKEIYDHTFWMSKDFDARAYGREFDFSRPFFEQFAELAEAVPKPNIAMIRCEDMEFCNYAVNSRQCYLAFNAVDCERLFYTSRAMKSKDSIGLHNCVGCERCYECIGCRDLYNVAWAAFSVRCTDSRFLYNCEDCNYCYQCANLKHKQYCIQNKQYSKEEYERKIAATELASRRVFGREEARWQEFLRTEPLQAQMNTGCERADGVLLTNCKDCRFCYSLSNSENCYNCYGAQLRDSADSSGYHGSEYLTVALGVVNSQNIFCSWGIEHGYDIGYSMLTFQAQECFGCFGLKNAKWCILNKEYPKDEYLRTKERIVAHMKATGEWGRYFPAKYSPFAFEESHGSVLFSPDAHTAAALGLRTTAPSPQPSPKKGEGEGEVLPAAELPDTPDEDQGAYTVLCEKTGRPFKIIPQEIEFYRRMRVPLPRTHWKVRLEQGYRAAFPLPEEGQCSACGKRILGIFPKNKAAGRPALCDVCYRGRFR